MSDNRRRKYPSIGAEEGLQHANEVESVIKKTITNYPKSNTTKSKIKVDFLKLQVRISTLISI